MKKLKIAFLILILAGGTSFLMLNFVLPSSPPPVLIFEQSFEKMSPVEFLYSLEKQTTVATIAGFAPAGWIKRGDVDALIKLVDSKDPCAPVVSALSSFLPRGQSTVGNEAMFLIEGYKSGRYPPALSSIGSSFKSKPEDYKKWWKEARQNSDIIYLMSDDKPGLPSDEVNQEQKIYVTHTQKDLEEFTDGLLRRYTLWLDKDAAGIVDKDWLYEKATKDRIPVVVIGYSNTIHAFRDVFQLLRSMHGPKIPEAEANKDGFCAYRFFDEVRGENSLALSYLSIGFPGEPTVKDVLNISGKINDGRLPLKLSDSFTSEQKAQYYYWHLRSNPSDTAAGKSLTDLLPLVSWPLLCSDNPDDFFNILAWLKDRSMKEDGDAALLSLMKSRAGLDGAYAEGYYSCLTDILESNPPRFIKLLSSLGSGDINELCQYLYFEVPYRKGLAEKLGNLAQNDLSQKEKEIVRQILNER